MSGLRNRVLTPDREPDLHRQCADIVEGFLAGASGIRGFTIRSALSAAKRSRPDLMERAASRLLPEFLDALDPIWSRHAGARSFTEALHVERDAACHALLAVAERRASTSRNSLVQTIYGRMRKGAERDIARLLPELGALVDETLESRTVVS